MNEKTIHGTPITNRGTSVVATLGLCFLLAACRPAPDDGATANWPHHGADHSSSKYAPHGQIDRGNFSELEIAWSWGSADSRIDEELRYFTGDYRATPIFVDGVLYTATNRAQEPAL